LRRVILSQAPRDLEALGTEHPHLRWRRAVDALHEAEREAVVEMDRTFRFVRFLIEIQRVWESRGSPGFGPTKEDKEEAELRLRAEYLS
jgi:hypothetical protein